MTNSHPPWAAYKALMLGRLISLENCPGIRPAGEGKTWRWMLVKCVLVVMGAKAK